MYTGCPNGRRSHTSAARTKSSHEEDHTAFEKSLGGMRYLRPTLTHPASGEHGVQRRGSIACAGLVRCNDEMDSSCDLVGIKCQSRCWLRAKGGAHHVERYSHRRGCGKGRIRNSDL